MAGYVPNAFRALLLEALAGRTTMSSATVYLGLATAIPEDPLTATLTNITEVTTTGYARKAIPAFNAASTTPPIQITTPTAFSFTAFTADMATPAYYAFVTAAASGTASPIRYIFELPSPVLAVSGVPVNIPANALIIE